MTAGLLFDVDHRGVASLVLNRPDAGNALDLQVAGELADALASIARRDDVRVIVLSAAGRIFCGGGDVHDMATEEDRPAFLTELAGSVHDSLRALDALPIPVVAAVQGATAGGGLGLLLAADVVVASSASSFATAYAGVGLSPDCGVSINLPRAIGLRRALQMLVRGVRIDAPTALDWGLVDEVVEPEGLEAALEEIVSSLLDRPVRAIGQARRLARAAQGRGFAEHLDDEAATIAACGASEEAQALLSSFR